MSQTIRSLLVGCLLMAGCHRAPNAVPRPLGARTVFTDSTLHSSLCQTPRPTEDWRAACTPKDQRAPIGPMPRDPNR